MSTECTVLFWDVQHGHSTYIKTPNDRHIVVDLGTGKYSDNNLEFSPLRQLKNNYSVNQLDYVLITHPHLDHIDDIMNFDLLNPKVLNRPIQLTNDEVMEGVRDKDRHKFEKYCEINDRYNAPIEEDSYNNYAKSGNWGDVIIKIFSPSGCDHDYFNKHSKIMVIEYAKLKIVIPGDNERCSYDELMQQESFLAAIKDSDILLAPHHGRESGYYDEFVDHVNPRLTVVSDGKYCDTSANDRYSDKSRGWKVHRKNGNSLTRKCLTTNSDGPVRVNFGYNDNNNNFLSVNIS